MKRQGNIVRIHIANMCFDYRDNILFYAYVLDRGKWPAWKRFARTCTNRKIRPYIFRRLQTLYVSIRDHGVTRPIPVLLRRNRYYPLNGAKRLGATLALHRKRIHVRIVESRDKQARVWNRDHSINGAIFRNCPPATMCEFLLWRSRFHKRYRKYNHDK
jgi:hypothetical protein